MTAAAIIQSKPCERCGCTNRYEIGGACVTCSRDRASKRYAAKNPQARHKDTTTKPLKVVSKSLWRHRNPEKAKESRQRARNKKKKAQNLSAFTALTLEILNKPRKSKP